MAHLPKLRELSLSGTKVTDVSPLAKIPTLEMIWLYATPVEDVGCLAGLPKLNDLNLLKTNVTDLSVFCDREKIILIERKKRGIGTDKKTTAEIKQKAMQLKEKAEEMGISLNPCLKRTQIKVFEEQYGVKLPQEYKAFLTQIGDGLKGEIAISPLEQLVEAVEPFCDFLLSLCSGGLLILCFFLGLQLHKFYFTAMPLHKSGKDCPRPIKLGKPQIL